MRGRNVSRVCFEIDGGRVEMIYGNFYYSAGKGQKIHQYHIPSKKYMKKEKHALNSPLLHPRHKLERGIQL